jgi:hypothetical protein
MRRSLIQRGAAMLHPVSALSKEKKRDASEGWILLGANEFCRLREKTPAGCRRYQENQRIV